MSDLIDRQAAINALGERPMVWTDSDYEIAQRNQYDMDRLAIETVPPAQPEQRWIPCSERLPEDGGWYITTYRITKDNNKCVGLLWYSTAHGWEWDNAIAWMPLPESYRG